MTHDRAPDDVVQLADARAAARRARDWSAADELLGRIRETGWKVIDVGTLYDLVRAAPPDVIEGAVVRHGASSSVPSVLEAAPAGTASVIMLASDWPQDVDRSVRALAATSPPGTQIVIVANGESDAQAAALGVLEAECPLAEGIVLEVVRTSVRLGVAAAFNAGIRRATAPVVLLLDASVEPQSDLVTPLVDALADPTVAVTGPFGIVSEDLRRFTEPAEGVVDVDAIGSSAMAFRRSDYIARGPLDEHFFFFRNLDVWWSLVLRDQGEDEPDDADPRRALQVAGISIRRHEHRDWSSLADEERDRLSRKNFYRVLKRFASRRDLLTGGGTSTSRA